MKYNEKMYSEKHNLYYVQEREEMIKFIPEDGLSILDVGCSAGGFGRLIKKRFPNSIVWGIEPNVESYEKAKLELDFTINDIFSSQTIKEEIKFDLIFFNDVLEHMEDPWQALILSHKYLKNNGKIVASIPNIQCYTVIKQLIYEGDWKYTTSGILDKTHLRFFTKKSMIRLFVDCGFSIEVIEGANSVKKTSGVLKILNLFFGKKFENMNYITFNIVAEKKHG